MSQVASRGRLGARRSQAALAAVAVALVGCFGSSSPEPISIATDLPASTIRSEGRDLAFSGHVRPPDAALSLRGADGQVVQERDGRFTVELVALRRGLTSLTLRAGTGGRPAVFTVVRVVRDGLLAPRAREPQADSRSGFGAPGTQDATGGRIDLALQAFAVVPRRVTARPGQIISWHNLDHADHLLRFDGPRAARMDTGRIGYDQRALRAVSASGTLHYHCAIHPWVRGQIKVVKTSP